MDMLQIKLPDSVSDESMTRIGELKVKFTPGAEVCRVVISKTASNVAGSARIVGNAVFTSSDGTANLGTSVDYPTDTIEFSLYIKGTGDFFVFFGEKYKMVAFTISADTPNDWIPSFEDCDFYACDNMKVLRLYRGRQQTLNLESLKTLPLETLLGSTASPGPFYGDVSMIASEAIKTLELVSGNELKVTGNIESFKDSDLLTSFVLLDTNCHGDISTLGKLTSATRILFTNAPNIEGEVTDLLDNLFANGKVSGTVTIRIAGTFATYNGQSRLTDISATFTSSGWSVA